MVRLGSMVLEILGMVEERDNKNLSNERFLGDEVGELQPLHRSVWSFDLHQIDLGSEQNWIFLDQPHDDK